MLDIQSFGLYKGQEIRLATLCNEHLQVEVISYGAITKSIRFNGQELILGYPDLDGYLTDNFYTGTIAGRCANRIAHGRFDLNGQGYLLARNSNGHHLHGGDVGFGTRIWDMAAEDDVLVLRLHSVDGDQGYPAAVDVTLRISLEAATLIYAFYAVSDAPTLINLAQHNYYALGGDMKLQIEADQYTPVDAELIPTGELKPVSGAFDFRRPKAMQSDLDHNFALSGGARLFGEKASVEITTDQPGLQAYSGRGLNKPFAPHQGVCLEPQFFPNAVNAETFETPVFGPDKPYHQVTRVAFSNSSRLL